NRGFPPPGCLGLRPIAGYRVPSRPNGITLVVAMSASQLGTRGFAGVLLEYRVGGRHYRAFSIQGGEVCVPASAVCDDSTLEAIQQRLMELLSSGRFEEAYRRYVGS